MGTRKDGKGVHPPTPKLPSKHKQSGREGGCLAKKPTFAKPEDRVSVSFV